MQDDLTRRVFVVEEMDSGAFVFDSYLAARGFIQLHLGVNANWADEDMPGAPTSSDEGLRTPAWDPTKPQEWTAVLKDNRGDQVTFRIKAYTLVDDKNIEDAYQMLGRGA
jgi:hypothetical protein